MKMLPIFSLTLLLILSGCQSYTSLGFFDTPGQIPPSGSIIELHQPLPVRPGYSRSFIQHGKTIHSNERDLRLPYCQFNRNEPRQAIQTKRIIHPDRFTIIHSSTIYDVVLLRSLPVASSVITSQLFQPDSDGPNDMYLSTLMKLKSDNQPQVVELKCAIFATPFIDNFLTLQEIIDTLGKVATLLINQENIR